MTWLTLAVLAFMLPSALWGLWQEWRGTPEDRALRYVNRKEIER